LFDVERRTVLRSVTDAVTGIGTGLKLRVLASCAKESQLSPACVKMSRAASSVSQPSTATRDMLLSSRTRSNCGPLQLLSTTAQGYPAASVSWMMSAAAAPCRAASSYL
jgi:hypothetical protein